MPPVLRGPAPVASWAPARLPAASYELLDTLTALYRDDPVFANALAEGRRTQSMTSEVLGGAKNTAAGNLLGPQHFRTLAEAAGRLLAAPKGPRYSALLGAIRSWPS